MNGTYNGARIACFLLKEMDRCGTWGISIQEHSELRQIRAILEAMVARSGYERSTTYSSRMRKLKTKPAPVEDAADLMEV